MGRVMVPGRLLQTGSCRGKLRASGDAHPPTGSTSPAASITPAVTNENFLPEKKKTLTHLLSISRSSMNCIQNRNLAIFGRNVVEFELANLDCLRHCWSPILS